MTREELLLRILESKVKLWTEFGLCCAGKCGDGISSAFEEMEAPTPRRLAELAVQRGWTHSYGKGAVCRECAEKFQK